MPEKNLEQQKKHAVVLRAREYMQITGVQGVESFDDTTVRLQTEHGAMIVEGEALHVGTLDMERGLLEITGNVSGVYYEQGGTPRRGLRARLFG